MIGYILKRSLFIVITFWGILTFVFFLSHVIPGDPAIVVAGPKATAEQIQRIRHQYGFDRPLAIQYVIYVKNLVARGDLGISIYTQRPVSQEIAERLPATLELVIVAMVLAVIGGVSMGVVAAIRVNTWWDYFIRTVTVAGIAIPGFWLAVLLQLIFFFYLGLLPAEGRITAGLTPTHVTGFYLLDSLLSGNLLQFADCLRHLVLPAFCLSLSFLAQIARVTRGAMLNVIHELYITKARSIGLRESTVLFKHALRNAFLPVLTAIGMYTGLALGGSVVIESVFSWRGIGYYMYKCVINTDFNGIMGITLFFAGGYLLINFLVDLLYPIVNPQVRLE